MLYWCKGGEKMREEYGFFIFLTVIGLLVGIAFIYCLIKDRKTKQFTVFFKLAVVFWLLMPLLQIIGIASRNDLSFFASAGLAMPLSIIFILAELLARYNRCTHRITATYTSCRRTSSRGSGCYTPIFSYRYNGEDYVNLSLRIYFSRWKLDRLFQEGRTYEIYINPRFPGQCTEKHSFPMVFIWGISLCGIWFLCALGLFLQQI